MRRIAKWVAILVAGGVITVGAIVIDFSGAEAQDIAAVNALEDIANGERYYTDAEGNERDHMQDLNDDKSRLCQRFNKGQERFRRGAITKPQLLARREKCRDARRALRLKRRAVRQADLALRVASEALQKSNGTAE